MVGYGNGAFLQAGRADVRDALAGDAAAHIKTAWVILKAAPHDFDTHGGRGVTFARRNSSTVFGVNMGFSAISNLLAEKSLPPSSWINLLRDRGMNRGCLRSCAQRSAGRPERRPSRRSLCPARFLLKC